jgi:hypothetical protein
VMHVLEYVSRVNASLEPSKKGCCTPYVAMSKRRARRGGTAREAVQREASRLILAFDVVGSRASLVPASAVRSLCCSSSSSSSPQLSF